MREGKRERERRERGGEGRLSKRKKEVNEAKEKNLLTSKVEGEKEKRI